MRIVTRPDFDGIVCAVLLKEALSIQKPVKWVEPNQMHRGHVDIQKGDIIANMAYDDRCCLWFDHHSSNRVEKPFKGCFKLAPSAARIIFEYYQNEFDRNFSYLVRAADKIDSADLTMDEVLHPEKYPYIMLSNTISSVKSNDSTYWNHLVEILRTSDINEIVKDTRVKDRIKSVSRENQAYRKVLKENTRIINHVSITDFRSFTLPPAGDRFLVFPLYPESSVNLKIRFNRDLKDLVVVSIGHSIFNKSCQVDIGELCSRFGGGGHRGAGSCSFSKSQSEINIQEIIDILISNQKNKE
ncbi:MAG: exopolyphosphatase [Candidatus Aminicenantes bacterium]|nr:exopolyphosphatase [Candidatus Aminicenantes bacterium]